MWRLVLAGAACVAALTAGLQRAEASFEVCNRSNETAEVAIGYKNDTYGWTSEGWWEVKVGECVDILPDDLDERYYYVYATGKRKGVWAGSKSQSGGFFCVSDRKFTYHNREFSRGDEINCERNRLTTKKFIEVDTKDASSFTFNLRN